MKNTRALLWRCFGSWISASLILAACGGQPTGARPPVVAGEAGIAGNNIRPQMSFGSRTPNGGQVRWWVNIHNDTGLPRDHEHPDGNYLWVTRYYTTGFFVPWFIEGADCLAPHETILRDIPFGLLDEQKGVKLRVEVKAYGATSCNAPNISDFYGPEDYLRFIRLDEHGDEFDVDWILGYASIDVIPPHFHIFMRADTASGKGPGPGPGIVKKDGGQ